MHQIRFALVEGGRRIDFLSAAMRLPAAATGALPHPQRLNNCLACSRSFSQGNHATNPCRRQPFKKNMTPNPWRECIHNKDRGCV